MYLFKKFKILVLLITLQIVAIQPVSSSEYVLIVNANNTINGTHETIINEVKRLYLKENTAWSNGLKSKPLSAKNDSEEHQAFLKNVLGMNSYTLARHWLKAKQKSGKTPPQDINSAYSIIKLVARSKGSFGYIRKSDTEKSDPKIRILFEF